MNFEELKRIYSANADRLRLITDYLERYRVTGTSHVSSSIRGYSDARKNDLILIPNGFESEIVDNIANWAFARGFSISTSEEKDKEVFENFVQTKGLNVYAKQVAKSTLSTGQGLLMCYSNEENEIGFHVPEPDMVIYLSNSIGKVEKFAQFYWIQETEGFRLYCDAIDDFDVTTFKADSINSTAMFSSLPEMTAVKNQTHNFKSCPAVILDMTYPAFFKVIKLIDAYNKLITETNDQFSAFKAIILALKNAILTDSIGDAVINDEKAKEAYDKLMKMSVFLLREDGEAEFLKREVQTDAFECLEKVLRTNIDRFSGNINYADSDVLGKATNLTINTRTKQLDNKAKDLTDIFQLQFRKLLEIINKFWAINGKSVNLKKIMLDFNYDKPANLPEEATTVQTLVNGGVPKKYAYAQFSGFTNPDQVATEAEENNNDSSDGANY